MDVNENKNAPMTHEQLMRLAISATRRGMEAGQSPFGACIARGGKVIAVEHNRVWADADPTAHAEVQAIRTACRELGTIDLSGCDIYSTCEPCPMCFAAIHWARISRVYFGCGIADAAGVGFNELRISNEQLKSLGRSGVEIVPALLAEPCRELLVEWVDHHDGRVY